MSKQTIEFQQQQQRPCALCLLNEPLCDSHIVPEFTYSTMYDEKHRIHAIPGHAPEENFWLQKGLRYPLLCKGCEAFINTTYEYPFKRFWIDGRQLENLRAIGRNVLLNIDYAKFKLFHLSVLWRAGVCRNPAFHRVNLGPHAETIRQMLLSEDPGPATRYPIACGVLIDTDDGTICDSLVTSPLSLTVFGHRGYTISFAGCQWIYIVSSHPLIELTHLQLSERGILQVDALSVQRFFRKFYEVSKKMTSPGVISDARRLLSPAHERMQRGSAS